ncbi:MAG: TlpA family protein disulfide reductase [Actinomycetota bacterium]|nr:TlpA family protein disulfide reductase [Actinomycetota bacterium]
MTFRAVPAPRARSCTARVRAAAAVALAALLPATGCTESMGGPEGFVAGSGTVTVLKEADRPPAPPLSGRTLDGDPLALGDLTGSTVVLNVWGSWCAPCRDEAPDLVRAYEQLRDEQVEFVGVNVREAGVASARAFARRFDVPYPSIYDADGSELLGFRDTLPPDAIPSTLVIDERGQVAARVLGTVDTSTLVGLVHDVGSSTDG